MCIEHTLQLLVYVKRQLATSIEEDKANAANFSIIKDREEEARTQFFLFQTRPFTGHFRKGKTGGDTEAPETRTEKAAG